MAMTLEIDALQDKGGLIDNACTDPQTGQTG
jgi:hypothetical protein